MFSLRVSLYMPDGPRVTPTIHVAFFIQYIQKKHPSYSSMKDETVWSFERLQSYIDEHHAKGKGLADNWMFTTFTVSSHVSVIPRTSIPSDLVIFCFIETNATNYADMFSQCSQEVASQKWIF